MSNKTELLQRLTIDRSGTGRKPRSVRNYAIAGAVALAVIIAVVLAARPAIDPARRAADAAVAETASTVPPAQPAAPAVDSVLNASGYVTARRMATVSAEIMGRITEVAVEEGMAVQAGQVLARLDDALVRVDLAHAQAQMGVLAARQQSVEAELAEARRVLQRVTALQQTNFSSEADITGAQANVDRLRAALAGVQADRRVAELEVARQRERLDDHVIRAPFAGIVTEKNAQPGEIVSPSSAGGGFTRTGICTIVDMDSLEIEVDVNEAFIGRVSAGQPVEARLDAYPDWTMPASVLAVIPTADRAKATVRVRIGIDVKDPRILPDMGVKVAFLRQDAAGVTPANDKDPQP